MRKLSKRASYRNQFYVHAAPEISPREATKIGLKKSTSLDLGCNGNVSD